MWRSVAKKVKGGSRSSPGTLKKEWLDKHPKFGRPIHLCFFCEYDSDSGKRQCSKCPAVLVSAEFGKYGCEQWGCGYHWIYEPIAFYNKLRALNRKRTKK